MRNVICPHQDAAFGTQTSSFTGSSVATTGWKPGPTAVVVYSTTDCYVRVGESATATSADFPLFAYQYIVLDVPPGTGATWQVAAIRQATSGTLYAKPLSA